MRRGARADEIRRSYRLRENRLPQLTAKRSLTQGLATLSRYGATAATARAAFNGLTQMYATFAERQRGLTRVGDGWKMNAEQLRNTRGQQGIICSDRKSATSSLMKARECGRGPMNWDMENRWQVGSRLSSLQRDGISLQEAIRIGNTVLRSQNGEIEGHGKTMEGLLKYASSIGRCICQGYSKIAPDVQIHGLDRQKDVGTE